MTSVPRVRGALTALAVAGIGIVGGCARQGAPPGGPQDRRPPVVIETEPDTFAVLTEPFRGPVVFRFDERISERPSTGSLDDAVIVSPETGNVRVSHGRRSIEVTMGGGFEPGRVYRVTLLPVIKDLFNNAMMDPVELVFSTGAPITASAIAGEAWDRVTGQGMEDVLVTATSADSTTYLARTDTGGIYALRYLLPGTYRLTAFEDRNRNDRPDASEPQGTRVDSLSGPDTLFTDIPLLQPDTTPAQLTSASVLDSVTVALLFDDYLDPGSPSSQIAARIQRDDEPARAAGRVFQEFEYAAYVQQAREAIARRDSLRAAEAERARDTMTVADTAVRKDTTDTTGAAADSAAARSDTTPPRPRIAQPRRPEGPPELPPAPGATRTRGTRGGTPTVGPDGEPLPGRRLVILLPGPLVPDTTYKVTVQGVVNVNGLPDGGGEVDVVREAPPDTAAVGDTASAADTVPVADTVPPDTALVPFLSRRQR